MKFKKFENIKEKLFILSSCIIVITTILYYYFIITIVNSMIIIKKFEGINQICFLKNYLTLPINYLQLHLKDRNYISKITLHDFEEFMKIVNFNIINMKADSKEFNFILFYLMML